MIPIASFPPGLFAAAFADAPVAMALVGLDGRLLRVNHALSLVIDRDPSALRGTSLRALLHPDDAPVALASLPVLAVGELAAAQAETRLLARGGETPWVLLSLAVVRDGAGQPACFVLHAQDITARKEREERLRHRTLHDPLTGLPNRTLFVERAARVLAGPRDQSTHAAAALLLDLDGFKAVNDRLGHDAGDRLLMAIGQRLATCLRSGDTAARFGGDEFAVLVERTSTPRDAAVVAERLLAAMRAPVWLEGREVAISASIGIARDQGDHTVATLLREADIALYRAKAAGPGVFVAADDGRGPGRAVVRRHHAPRDLSGMSDHRAYAPLTGD